jgi:hypothetical protein
MTAGYSGKSLLQKLGIKAGWRLIFLNAPAHYDAALGALPEGTKVQQKLSATCDFIQFFTTDRAELETQFPALKAALKPEGMLWISWPKKAAKIPTNLDENIIRDTGLRMGLVDVKVIAVDEKWSGLKFVYRLKDRPPE